MLTFKFYAQLFSYLNYTLVFDSKINGERQLYAYNSYFRQ